MGFLNDNRYVTPAERARMAMYKGGAIGFVAALFLTWIF